MKLYIANATPQKFIFNYRLPGVQSLRVTVVERGQQMQVGGDMTSDEVGYILEKAAPFGLVTVTEAERLGNFSGVCYSVDRPIKEDQLRRAMMRRLSVLDGQGHEMRHAAAIGAHIATQAHLRQHQELGADILSMDTTIVEQDIRGGRHNLVNPLEESHKVLSAGQEPNAPVTTAPRGRGGKRGRAA